MNLRHLSRLALFSCVPLVAMACSPGEESPDPVEQGPATSGGPGSGGTAAGTGGTSGFGSGGVIMAPMGSGGVGTGGGTAPGSGGMGSGGLDGSGGSAPSVPGTSACSGDPAGVNVGDFMEDFELTDHNGETFRLRDHCDKAVLLVVVGGWCGICRGEAPRIQELHETYESQGLVVASMYTDGPGFRTPTDEDTLAWATEYGLTHPVLNDAAPGSVANNYVPANSRPWRILLGPGAEIKNLDVSPRNTAAIEAVLP